MAPSRAPCCWPGAWGTGDQSSARSSPGLNEEGENSLLELMLGLSRGAEDGEGVTVSAMEGAMGGLGEGLQVLGSSWAPGTVTPIPAELCAPVPAPQGEQMGCFGGLADLQSPALCLTVKGLL